MVSINAFQVGQQFNTQQENLKQATRASKENILLQQQQNERADKSFAVRQQQQSLENQRRATDDQRLAAADLAAKAERDRLAQVRVARTSVKILRSGRDRGIDPAVTINRLATTLAGLGMTAEQIKDFPQQLRDNPGLYDQLDAAFAEAEGPREAIGRPIAIRLPDGRTALGQAFDNGDFEIVEGGVTPLASELAQQRGDIAQQRAGIAQQQAATAQQRVGVSQQQADIAQQKIDPTAAAELAGAKGLSKTAAEEAVRTLETNFSTATAASQSVRSADAALVLLDEGIRTGSLAAARQGAARFFKDILGLKDSQVATTDEFFARTGIAVAQQIQAFGAGTGLSDADREFARGIVGGDIAMDEQAIRRLLAARRDIDRKTVEDFNTRRESVLSTASATTRAQLPGAVELSNEFGELSDEALSLILSGTQGTQ